MLAGGVRPPRPRLTALRRELASHDFQDPIDAMTIRHYDIQDWNGFQWIGIHDLHWC